MHQRYTSLGHTKHVTETEKTTRYAAIKKETTPASETMIITAEPVAGFIATPAVQQTQLTAGAAMHSGIIARKPITKLAVAGFVNTTTKFAEKSGATKLINKQVKQEKHEKRGLLFGLISTLLSIIILVVIVLIIAGLILILI